MYIPVVRVGKYSYPTRKCSKCPVECDVKLRSLAQPTYNVTYSVASYNNYSYIMHACVYSYLL